MKIFSIFGKTFVVICLFIGFALLIPGSSDCAVVFNADFNADTPGQAPNLSPPGFPASDYITLQNAQTGGNSMLVQGPVTPGFSSNSLRIVKAAIIGNSPIFEGHQVLACGPYDTGVYTVTWSSLSEQNNNNFGFAALVDTSNLSAFIVNYSADGNIKFQDGSGVVVTTGIPYSANVPQTFSAVVDLNANARTFDLSIDGVQVGSARPFYDTLFSGVDRFFWEIGGTVNESYAIDSISISTNLPDFDGDGIPDCMDNCPYIWNPDQRDYSAGIGDACNTDVDRDGVSDKTCVLYGTFPPGCEFSCLSVCVQYDPLPPSQGGDNCPYISNTDQKDTFHVGIGDACNPDIDGDVVPDKECVEYFLPSSCGLCDGCEFCPPICTQFGPVSEGGDNCPYVYHPNQTDTDLDGVGDACDNCPMDPNPLNPDGTQTDVCSLKYYGNVINPPLVNNTITYISGAPMLITSCFKFDSSLLNIYPNLQFFRPTCYNTFMSVFDSLGNPLPPNCLIGPPQGVPDDLVPLSNPADPTGQYCVTCDLSLRYPQVIMVPGLYTFQDTYANFIVDPDRLAGRCSDVVTCYDIWVGSISTSEITLKILDPSEPIPVKIDFKPGTTNNTVNLGSNGNVPVAIFSSYYFDATTIDPKTVKLSGAGGKVTGKGTKSTIQDVNGDGLLDMIVYINVNALGITGPDGVPVTLTGSTKDGNYSILGTDTVRVVGSKNK
jgi:hypothetical protein